MKKLKKEVGNWVAGEERFWDREAEIPQLVELLDSGAHVLVVAPRRVGKTSLMREVARRIDARFTCLFIDLQKAQSPADAMAELAFATRPLRRRNRPRKCKLLMFAGKYRQQSGLL